jgi:hypothetical protein
MTLKQLLDAGMSVIGTKFDKGPGLGGMSEAAQKRHGYLDSNGYWTDRGWNRANTKDVNAVHQGTRARFKSGR